MAKILILDTNFQLGISFLIFLNFLTTAVSVTQLALDNPSIVDLMEMLDWVFVSIFLVELTLNIFAHCNVEGEDVILDPCIFRWEFFVGDNWWWNTFDLVIIV